MNLIRNVGIVAALTFAWVIFVEDIRVVTVVMGVVISACALATWDLLLAAVRATDSAGPGTASLGTTVTASSGWLGPVPVIAVSLAILAVIVIGAEVLSLVVKAHKTPTPPPVV